MAAPEARIAGFVVARRQSFCGSDMDLQYARKVRSTVRE